MQAAARAGGPAPSPPPPDASGRPTCGIRGGFGSLAGNGFPLNQLSATLSQLVRRTVIDRTGLSGTWAFDLKFAPDPNALPPGGLPPGVQPPVADPDSPSIFTAVEEQLGLKLESTRGPVEMLVVDRLERPTRTSAGSGAQVLVQCSVNPLNREPAPGPEHREPEPERTMRRVLQTVSVVVCLAIATEAPHGLWLAALAAGLGIARTLYAQQAERAAIRRGVDQAQRRCGTWRAERARSRRLRGHQRDRAATHCAGLPAPAERANRRRTGVDEQRTVRRAGKVHRHAHASAAAADDARHAGGSIQAAIAHGSPADTCLCPRAPASPVRPVRRCVARRWIAATRRPPARRARRRQRRRADFSTPTD